MEELIIKDGAIEVGEKDTDFLIGDIGEGLPNLEEQDNIIHEYSQGNTNDCTIYGSMGALSDLMNYEFSSEEISEMNEISYTKGRVRGRGRYTQMAVDVVREYWNKKYPDRKVITLRLTVGDDGFKEAFNKGYTIVTTYKGNSDYNRDYWFDGVVDGTKFRPSTYGHCVALTTGTIRNLGDGTFVKDNYKGFTVNGNDRNTYKLADLDGLVNDATYYPACYIFVKENSLEKNEAEIKRLAEFRWRIEQNIKNNSDMRHLTNDPIYKDWLHKTNNQYRDKLKDVHNEESKFL